MRWRQKKNTPSPLNLDGATSASTEEVSASVAPSISRVEEIKISDKKQRDLNTASTIKKKMAEDLLANPTQAYKDSYIKSLSKSFNPIQLKAYADSVVDTRTEEEKQREKVLSELRSEVKEREEDPSLMNRMAESTGEFFIERAEGAKHGLEKMRKGVDMMSKGLGVNSVNLNAPVEERIKQYQKDKDKTAIDMAADVGKGAVKTVAGVAGVAFNILPEAVAFQAATEAIKAADKTEDKWISEAVDIPFTIVDKTIDLIHAAKGETMMYSPQEDEESFKNDVKELGNIVVGGIMLHKAMKVGGKVIKDVKSYNEALKDAADGNLSKVEMEELQNYSKELQGITLEDIKQEAQAQGNENIVNKIDEISTPEKDVNDEVAELKSDLEKDPSLAPIIQPKIDALESDIATKDLHEAGTMLNEARINAEISNLEAKKEGASEATQKIIDQQVNELKQQLKPIENEKEASKEAEVLTTETGTEPSAPPVIEEPLKTEINDSENKTGVTGEVREGQEPVQAEPNESRSPQEIGDSGMVQEAPQIAESFRHEDINEQRKQLGLDEIRKKEPKSEAEAIKEADDYIRDGGSIEKIVDDINRGNDKPGMDHIILSRYMQDLSRKMTEAKGEELNSLIQEADRISKAMHVESSRAGSELQARQIAMKADDSLAGYFAKMKEAKGEELTPEEASNIQKTYKEYENKSKPFEDLEKEIKDLRDEVEKLKAEQNLKRSTPKIRRHLKAKNIIEDAQRRRKSYVEQLKEELKGRPEDPVKHGISLSNNAIKLIAKIAETHAEELYTKGKLNLEDVVEKVYEDVKDLVDGIKRGDIVDVLAGKYKEKNLSTKTEIEQRFSEIKKEAQLLQKLKDLKDGTVEQKLKVREKEYNEEIANLNEQIKELQRVDKLQKELDDLMQGRVKEKGESRELTEKEKELKDRIRKEKEKLGLFESKKLPKTEQDIINESIARKEQKLKDVKEGLLDAQKERRELTDYEKSLNEQIKETIKEKGLLDERNLEKAIERNYRRIQQIQEMIDKGEWTTEEKKTLAENADIKKKFPGKHETYIKSQLAKNKAKAELDKMVLDQQVKALKGRMKFAHNAKLVKNTAIVLKAGIDFSTTLIQNALAILRRPKAGIKNTAKAFEHFASQEKFETELQQHHNAEYWPIIESMGVDVLDPMALHDIGREDAFHGNLIDKDIDIKGKKYNVGKYTVRRFERYATSLGNNMRISMALERAKEMMEDGMTPETHPEEFKAAGKVVNNFTMRGTMHERIKRSKELLSWAFWSPSMMAGSLNLLGVSDAALFFSKEGGFYKSLTPKQREYVARELGRTAINTALLYGSLKLMNYDNEDYNVEVDPASSDFLSIQFEEGGDRYNPLGPVPKYVKLATVIAAGEKAKDGKSVPINTLDEIQRFLRGKVNPVTGEALNFLGKKMYDGTPWTLKESLKEMVSPMNIKDEIEHGLREEGMSSWYKRFAPSLFMNVSNPRDYEKTPEEEREKKLLQREQKKEKREGNTVAKMLRRFREK